MHKLVTAELMRKIDELSIDNYGTSEIKLMTNAGIGVYRFLKEREELSDKNIVIICGKGNNGGDGLVVAEELLKENHTPLVYIFSSSKEHKGVAKKVITRIKKKFPDFKIKYLTDIKGFSLKNADIIIDAIFGTGFNSNPEGLFFDVIKAINESKALVYSIDIPSGVHGSTGNIEDIAVKADYTITFGYPKLGLYLSDGYSLSGEVSVAEIGLPAEVDEEVQESRVLIDINDLKGLIRSRPVVCDKKDYGKIFSFSGSISMPGAAVLSSLAALRTGTGLLKLGIPMNVSAAVSAAYPEIMTIPLAYTQPGYPSGNAEKEILKGVKWANAILMGPGLSVHPETKNLVKRVLTKQYIKPTVLDADALNILSESPDLISRFKENVILTPHNSEMARLLNMPKELFLLNRIETVTKKAMEWQCYIVLKGTPTIVACPDGSAKIFINKCPALATGGTGDVFAGVLASLIGQKYETTEAIILALYIHKFAADFAVENYGEDSILPSDIVKNIPKAIMKIKNL